MELLPMVPASCSLDEIALNDQLARYRDAGRGALVIERYPRRLVIRVDDEVPDRLIEELIGVELECCSFFDIDWQASRRQLAIAVPDPGYEPALAAVASALGLAA